MKVYIRKILFFLWICLF